MLQKHYFCKIVFVIFNRSQNHHIDHDYNLWCQKIEHIFDVFFVFQNFQFFVEKFYRYDFHQNFVEKKTIKFLYLLTKSNFNQNMFTNFESLFYQKIIVFQQFFDFVLDDIWIQSFILYRYYISHNFHDFCTIFIDEFQ